MNMPVEITKTKAEQDYLDNFAAAGESLAALPQTKDIRTNALKSFEEQGLPDRRVEAWKYTDLRAAYKDAYPLASENKSEISENNLKAAIGTFYDLDCYRVIFVNGRYRYDKLGYGEGLDVTPLSEVLQDKPDFLSAKLGKVIELPEADPTVDLNTAFLTDGIVINVTAGEVDKPIHIVYLNSDDANASVAVRNFVDVAKGTKATVIEQFVSLGKSSYQTNAVTEAVVADDAELTHFKFQSENTGSTHLSSWMTEIGADAKYDAFQLTTGAKLSRDQLFVRFAGENGNFNFGGAFLGREDQHGDTTMVVNHAVPKCESREHYKGVMADNAKGVFQGKLMVHQIAQKTDGKQMAQALLLSETAEFDAKPELEIFADDVVCGHGATSGQIDEELLFYLKARGIPDKEARSLLVQAFIGEVLELVENDDIRENLTEIASDWLGNTKG